MSNFFDFCTLDFFMSLNLIIISQIESPPLELERALGGLKAGGPKACKCKFYIKAIRIKNGDDQNCGGKGVKYLR